MPPARTAGGWFGLRVQQASRLARRASCPVPTAMVCCGGGGLWLKADRSYKPYRSYRTYVRELGAANAPAPGRMPCSHVDTAGGTSFTARTPCGHHRRHIFHRPDTMWTPSAAHLSPPGHHVDTTGGTSFTARTPCGHHRRDLFHRPDTMWTPSAAHLSPPGHDVDTTSGTSFITRISSTHSPVTRISQGVMVTCRRRKILRPGPVGMAARRISFSPAAPAAVSVTSIHSARSVDFSIVQTTPGRLTGRV